MARHIENNHKESIINIMISSDNHLGYLEENPIRGNDSFISFEEMLKLAVEKKADLILLGGDVFHVSPPSIGSMHKCLNLLRQYIVGDHQPSLHFTRNERFVRYESSDQAVNCRDPKMNVSIPVFSVHGCHDEPLGFGEVDSANILDISGLMFYFGRWTGLEQIYIKPILLRKGNTYVALYGLSHVDDSCLLRLFKAGKVIMEQPPESTAKWFSILVLHQNRADRSMKNRIPENVLPGFLDLIVWGHEHACRVKVEANVKKNFSVTQPGSTVATSLVEGETQQKQVGILRVVKKKAFKILPLPLQTVRPFIFESINLSDYNEEYGLDEGGAAEKVQKIAHEKIEKMIKDAKGLLTGHPKQSRWPLIRLRIVYSEEEQMFDAVGFAQRYGYNEKIANYTDMILFSEDDDIDTLCGLSSPKTSSKKTISRASEPSSTMAGASRGGVHASTSGVSMPKLNVPVAYVKPQPILLDAINNSPSGSFRAQPGDLYEMIDSSDSS